MGLGPLHNHNMRPHNLLCIHTQVNVLMPALHDLLDVQCCHTSIVTVQDVATCGYLDDHCLLKNYVAAKRHVQRACRCRKWGQSVADTFTLNDYYP
jgi:hypothetical protein